MDETSGQRWFLRKYQGGAIYGPISFDQLAARAVASHTGLRSFASSLTVESLANKVRIPWFPDPPCIIGIAEALLASPRDLTGDEVFEP